MILSQPKFIPAKNEYDDIRVYSDTPNAEKRKVVYNSKLGGYICCSGDTIVGVVIGSLDDYLRYLGGARSHLYSLYNPDIHKIVAFDEFCCTDTCLETGVYGFVIFEHNSSKTQISLPYGTYSAVNTSTGIGLLPMEVSTDKYIACRNDVSALLHNKLKSFINNKHLYDQQEDVRHRYSILMYGAPGNGKTREICKVLEDSKQNNLISIFIPNSVEYLSMLEPFKYALSGQNVFMVLEEITERTDSRRGMEDLLSFLDGETSWNDCFIVATTNNPEELPSKIADRPGRFKLILEVKSPTPEEITRYLKGRGISDDQIGSILEVTSGLSLDYIASSITESRIEGITIAEYLSQAKELRKKVSESFKGKIGFSDKSDDMDF